MLTLMIVLVCFGLIGEFYTRGTTLKHDTEAANEVFSWTKFLQDSALEIILSVGILVVSVLGLDTGEIIPKITPALGITGALIFGAGIPRIAVKYIMPIWGGGNKARKGLRTAVDAKTNELERLQKKHGSL